MVSHSLMYIEKVNYYKFKVTLIINSGQVSLNYKDEKIIISII